MTPYSEVDRLPVCTPIESASFAIDHEVDSFRTRSMDSSICDDPSDHRG